MTKFFVRCLIDLDVSEEPGVHDVLAVRTDGVTCYSPDVYDDRAEAEAAARAFAAEGETTDDWDYTQHPGIDIDAEPVA